MPSINVTADITDAANEMLRFNTVLDAQNKRLREITQTASTYNDLGVRVAGTVKGWTTDNQKFVATLKQVKDAQGVTSDSINIKLTETKKKANEARQALNDLNKAVNDVSKSAQLFATYSVFSAFVQGAKDGFNAARDLQIQISLIRTISQDAQQTFSQFNKDVVAVSNSTGLAIEDVGKAFFDTASNQIAKGGAIKDFVEEAANLAKTTGGTVTDAVNLLSSAMNSYNLPVTEARNLSALFFKTIDEGRVVMSEMANVFGRVGVQGKAVGVSITDLTGTVAFLTKQGVLTADAFTFVTNLLTQLQKPSRELQAFFKSIGSKDGIEAIGVFGFVGLIEKLTSEVKSGNVAATDFFKEIRAEKPFEAISNNLADFKRITKEFQDSKKLGSIFKEAIEIRGESPAAKLQLEFTKIRNFFVNDVGQSILGLVSEILAGLSAVSNFFTGKNDGIVGGVNIMVRVFKDGTIAVIAFRVAMATNAAVTLAYASAAATAGTATLSLGQKMAFVGAGLRAVLPGLLAVTAAFIAMDLLFKSDFLEKTDNSLGALEERIKSLRKEAQALGAVLDEGSNKKFVKDSEPRFQQALQGLAKAQVEADRQLTKIRQQNVQTAEAIGNTFQTYTDSLGQGISDLKKKLTDAKELIASTRKDLIGFRETLDGIILDTRLKFATDDQKLVLLKNRFNELIDKSQSLVGTGDNAKIQEGLKLLEEAAKLAQDRFELQTKIDGTTIVSTVPLQNDLNKVFSVRLSLQEQIERSKNREVANTQNQLDIEQKRLRDVEDAFKAFNKFSAFEAGGGIDPKFKEPITGKVKVSEVRAEFDRLSQALLGLAGKDINTRIGLEQLLAQRRKDIIEEVNAAERSGAIETTKTKVILAKREMEDRLAVLRKEFEEKAKMNERFQTELQDQVKPLSNLQKGVADTITDFTVDYKNILPGFLRRQIPAGRLEKEYFGDKTAIQKAFGDEAQLKFMVDKYKQAVDNITKNAVNVDGVLIPRQEDIESAEFAIKGLLAKVKEAYEPIAKKFGVGVEQLTMPGTNISIAEYQTAIGKVIEDLKKNFGELKKNYTAQERVKADALINLFPELDKVADKFGIVDAASAQTKAKIQADFSDISGAINGARMALEAFLNLLPGKGGEIGVNLGEGQYYADGGIVGFPGKPRGVDRHPIWAADGEMIINAESTAAFKDVLYWINGQRTPKHMNVGGLVGDTVNVGDINIVVNDSGSPHATAMATAKQLERQLRRNNIRLTRRK